MSTPKISEKAAEINALLEQAPPPKIQVYPDILTRKKTQAEIEKEKKPQTNL